MTIFSDRNPLMYLRECATNSAKLTRWALGLPEFMHAEYFSHVCSVRVKAKNKATITKATVKATNPFGQGNSHMLPRYCQCQTAHNVLINIYEALKYSQPL